MHNHTQRKVKPNKNQRWKVFRWKLSVELWRQQIPFLRSSWTNNSLTNSKIKLTFRMISWFCERILVMMTCDDWDNRVSWLSSWRLVTPKLANDKQATNACQMLQSSWDSGKLRFFYRPLSRRHNCPSHETVNHLAPSMFIPCHNSSTPELTAKIDIQKNQETTKSFGKKFLYLNCNWMMERVIIWMTNDNHKTITFYENVIIWEREKIARHRNVRWT